jgi:hypothetical protein
MVSIYLQFTRLISCLFVWSKRNGNVQCYFKHDVRDHSLYIYTERERERERERETERERERDLY